VVANRWGGVGERQRAAWFLLAVNLGLLVMTTYTGLILAAAIAGFLAATRRGRRALQSAEPWLASVVIIAILFPHLIWFDLAGDRLFDLIVPSVSGGSWLNGMSGFVEMLLLSHVGLVLLAVLGARWRWGSSAKDKAPVFV